LYFNTVQLCGKKEHMSQLATLLSSRGRAEMFRLLFGVPEELHLRELARRSGITPSAVRQELARLTELDLVLARRSGNRVYFQANPAHPLYPEIRSLVAKATGGKCHRANWPVRVSTLKDQGRDDDGAGATAADRLEMMWGLTKDAWAFTGGKDAQPRLPRHPVRAVRRGG